MAQIWLQKIPKRILLLGRYYCFPRHNTKPVFVLGTARSGSTLLLSYLSDFADVHHGGELLNSYMVDGVRRVLISKNARLRHIRYNLNHAGCSYVTVKILKWQMEAHDLSVADIKSEFQHGKFIVIFRRSILAQYLSSVTAKTTGVWFQYQRASQAGEVTQDQDHEIVIDRQELLAYIEQLKGFYRQLQESLGDESEVIFITYEDLVEDPQLQFQQRICPLLGLPPQKVKTILKKQSKGTLEDRIANYEEVRDLLEFRLDV